MTQMKIRLTGKTRQAVEEVLAHLQQTAIIQEPQWYHREYPYKWWLEATIALPAGSQLSDPSGSDGRPILVEELGLPTLTRNTLIRSRIETVEQLLEMPEEQVRNVRNLGHKGLQAIVDRLIHFGLFHSSALAKTWPD